MADFADYLAGLGLAQRTADIYVRHVEAADNWLSDFHTSLSWASAKHVAAYAASQIVNSHSSRGQAAAAFRHYWDWIERRTPPVRAVRVPSQPRMVCRALEPDEAATLTRAALGWYPQGLAVLFGLYLALRRFEIAKAEWSRFDTNLEWYTVTGKGDITATLPVHPILRTELEPTGRWVFPGRFDQGVTPATVWVWTKEVAATVGLTEFTTHRLRHTSLATANDALGDLRAVQTFARHMDPAQTAGYTRTTAARLREVSDALDYL